MASMYQHFVLVEALEVTGVDHTVAVTGADCMGVADT